MNAENMIIDGTTLVEYIGTGETVVVPEGVTGIQDRVFERSELKSITLPKSLQYIGAWAFFECKNLSEVIIPPNVHSIYCHAFHNSGITKIAALCSATFFNNSERLYLFDYAKSHQMAIIEYCICNKDYEGLKAASAVKKMSDKDRILLIEKYDDTQVRAALLEVLKKG